MGLSDFDQSLIPDEIGRDRSADVLLAEAAGVRKVEKPPDPETPGEVIKTLVRRYKGWGPRRWTRVTWRLVEPFTAARLWGIRHPDLAALPSNDPGYHGWHRLLLEGPAHTAYWKWVTWTEQALGRKLGPADYDRPIFSITPEGREPMTQRWFRAVEESTVTFEELAQITRAYAKEREVHPDPAVWPLVQRALRTRNPGAVVVTPRPYAPSQESKAGRPVAPLLFPEALKPAWSVMKDQYMLGTLASHKSRLNLVFDFMAREGRALPSTPGEVVALCLDAARAKGCTRVDSLVASWRALARAAAKVGIDLPIPPKGAV